MKNFMPIRLTSNNMNKLYKKCKIPQYDRKLVTKEWGTFSNIHKWTLMNETKPENHENKTSQLSL